MQRRTRLALIASLLSCCQPAGLVAAESGATAPFTVVAHRQDHGVALRTDPIGDVWDDIRPPGFIEALPANLQDLLVRNLPRGVVQRMLRRRVADFLPGKST